MATYNGRSKEPIPLKKIQDCAGTQYRVETDEAVVVSMEDLIERGIKFKTPMKIALFDGTYYLVDGFHRLHAYGKKGFEEIPAGQWECIQVEDFEEVRLLARGANVAHGKNNTPADYHYIIESLMELESGAYMKNVFEPDILKIAVAIGAPVPRVRAGYCDYFGTEKEPHPSLSQTCKEKRDAAVMRKHLEGRSDNEIARLFKMEQSTVTRIRGKLGQNTESVKCPTPNDPNVIKLHPTSTPDTTRVEDAGSYLSSLAEETMNKVPVEEEVLSNESPLPPIDLSVFEPKHKKPDHPETPEERLEREIAEGAEALSKMVDAIAMLKNELEKAEEVFRIESEKQRARHNHKAALKGQKAMSGT
ncbi:ParB/Srx family N-terminal domain-containing protein [Aeromonas veronii]|uniref:ParB/Srx family N-terminal domain-containing protein n=1 Tax=Aeromonas veronii TaxID=654 RepID=UPI000B59E45E|nr:ParB/Srx family N-terminal domain-containing protein [Aeromonas veronii]